MLKPGAGVVTSRNHVRFVVTEYGVANLYGKTIRQRAQQLIKIAHPHFREELSKQARELHYL
jgi:4-hydroxybutyrate CoA-transferase